MTNPSPKPGIAPHTVDLVMADLMKRKAAGVAKYGVPHQHDNGRDHLLDAYEEALDLCVYLRAELEKRRPEARPKGGFDAIFGKMPDLADARPEAPAQQACATCGGKQLVFEGSPKPNTNVVGYVPCPSCTGRAGRATP